ncbi:hypothetical protein [Streptomyces sp. JH34]|nr:hypothetical protein [Streptomyces sp. JH34]
MEPTGGEGVYDVRGGGTAVRVPVRVVRRAGTLLCSGLSTVRSLS